MNRPIAFAAIALLLLTAGLAAGQRSVDPRDKLPPRLTALDPRWTIAFETAPAAPAGFDRESAYVPSKTGDLIALSLDDGMVRWQAALATPFTPATGDGLVFASTGRTIIALEQRSGQQVWHLDVDSPLAAPLHWDSGSIIASTESGDLLALAAADGRVAWKTALGSPIDAAPTASRDRIYVSLRDGRIAAVDIESGATLWTQPLNQPVTGMLALQEQLLVGTKANLLHSLSLDRGRVRWTQKVGSDVIGAAAADEQLIYFVAYDNVLRALSRRNGNLRWTRNLPSRPSGGPVRLEDIVLVPFAAQTIGAYLAATGAESFTLRAAGEVMGAPFLRENIRATAPRVVAQTREGAIQSFAPRIEPPLAPLAALPGSPAGH